MTTIKRQFIADTDGRPVAVLLPLAEYTLVEEILEQRLAARSHDARLAQIAQAADDPLFMADLRETMDTFDGSDAEWWEPQG